MRRLIISVILFGIVGAILSTKAIGIYDWQFWIIMTCLCLIQINYAF